MPKILLPVCVTVSLLLSCGCQSFSPAQALPEQATVGECLPPPTPDAWWMAPLEPTLTEALLNELSASPSAATVPSLP